VTAFGDELKYSDYGFSDAQLRMLEHASTELNHARRSSYCLSMISAQTLRVCREGKPVSTFPDHAPV
jgi:hypothetical protein